jgi:hypothetical protein
MQKLAKDKTEVKDGKLLGMSYLAEAKKRRKKVVSEDERPET